MNIVYILNKFLLLSDPVFQLFRTGTPWIHTMVWLHHRICFLCYHAVAQLQSSAQRPCRIQSNRGEPNPERHRGGGGPPPALISAGLKKARVGRVMLSHRVSFDGLTCLNLINFVIVVLHWCFILLSILSSGFTVGQTGRHRESVTTLSPSSSRSSQLCTKDRRSTEASRNRWAWPGGCSLVCPFWD